MTAMDKNRKKLLKQQARNAERHSLLRMLPVDAGVMLRLLNDVDKRLAETECDRTQTLIKSICLEQALDDRVISEWLQNEGHYCDCEAAFNFIDQLEDAMKVGQGAQDQ